MSSARPIGFGCMRLSTDARRDEERAMATLRAAISAGATLLDTGDAYALDESERGHNERLVARAASGSAVMIATKGGLVRPNGKWVHAGRARQLREACEKSLRALGRDRIDLYQLHAPDPQIPFSTSVRALARLCSDGLIAKIGLCNVSATQLREALELTEIHAVQIALSPFEERAFRSGVLELCRERGILLLAHSPLGGPKRARRLAKDHVLVDIAARHGATPHQIALAWLYDLGAVPLPGATQPNTAHSAIAAASLVLDDDDRRALDDRFPLARLVREPRAVRKARADRDGEVVLLMGIPGAGKSTRVRSFVERGYVRLNRDEAGGTLAAIAQRLDTTLANGGRRVVLDNTYPTRASRNEVIETAWKHRLPVRCVWLDTPIEQAQINAAMRIVERHGALLGPAEIKAASRNDPNVFDPRVQFRYARELEPPHGDEGFAAIEREGFERNAIGGREATIVSLDAFAFVGDPPHVDRVRVDARRAAVLRTEPLVLATSWQPTGSDEVIEECFARVRAALELPIEIAVCRHPAGPPICWCRKPLPGLAVALIHRHGIDPARSRWVGTSLADRTLARHVGFVHVDADTLFGNPAQLEPICTVLR